MFYIKSFLCNAIVIGLTDNMRENFHLMKALAVHTRVTASKRVDMLIRFNETLRKETKVLDELKSWNLQLERNLVQVPARILSGEKLVFANNSRISCSDGDWTRQMQKAHLYQSKQLNNWVLIINQRNSRSLQVN